MRTLLGVQRPARMNPGRHPKRPYIRTFNAPGSAGGQVWTCPESGYYSVYLWGRGGRGHWTSGGGNGQSGALAVAERIFIAAGETVTFNIPVIQANPASGTATAVFSSGRQTLTCTPPDDVDIGSTKAFATGGTINFDGISGSGSPATGPGPDGGISVTASGTTIPGGPGYNGFKGGNATTGFPGGTPGAGSRSGSERISGDALGIVVREY